MPASSCSLGSIMSCGRQYRVLWNYRIIKVSVDYIMVSNRGTGIVCDKNEGPIWARSGDSKLFLVIIADWYGEKGITYSSKGTTSGRVAAIGVTIRLSF